jgi:hypothetical protein
MYLLQSLSCMYWALYLPFLVGGLVAFLWWRQRTPLRSLWPLASALALGVAVTALFAIPYLATARELGFERPEPISVPVDRYLDVLPENWLYAGFLGHALRNQNAAHFLGFLALALAVAGVLWRGAPEAAARLRPFLIVTALVGFVLSLGPWIQLGETTLAPGPYALLWRWVPGFRNVRYPERLSILLVLAFAPLVALGLARLRPRLGSLGAAALCGVLLLEHLSLPKSLSPLPAGAHIPSVYRWLRDQAEIQVIGEVPASPFLMERADALPMYLSTVHWKRTLQGYTSYFAPTYNFVKWRLGQFPGDASLGFLSRFGVDAVVVAPPAAAAIESLSGDPRVRIEGPFPEGHLVVQLPSARLDIPPPPDDDGGFVELERSGWDVEASAPGPGLAIDGDPRTAWATEQKQQQGDFYRVRFPAPVPLARISMVPDRVFTFPTAFKLVGQAGEEAVDLPFDAQLGYDRLFASLLHEPRRARLVLDLDGRELRGLRIRITETDPFAMTWIMSELRMYRRRPPP